MSGGGFVEPTLSESENVLGVFFGGKSQWGGKLILTDKRLLFAELDLGAIPDVLVYVGGQAGVPGLDLGKTILDKIQGSVKMDIWLRHIAEAKADGNGGVGAAPAIRITTATGASGKFGIVEKSTSWNLNPENRVIRDRALALIQQAVADAKRVPS